MGKCEIFWYMDVTEEQNILFFTLITDTIIFINDPKCVTGLVLVTLWSAAFLLLSFFISDFFMPYIYFYKF